MKLNWIISCIAIIGFISTGKAQESPRIGLQYSIGFPTGNMDDYIERTSFRGFSFSYQYVLSPSVNVGFEAGLNTFYEREYGTFREGTSALTGTQYRYSNNAPLLATFTYNIFPEQALTPYLGFGLGALYSRRDLDIGMYKTSADAWLFNLKPEIGLIYQVNPTLGIKVSGNYYSAFGNETFGKQSYGTLNLGIVIESGR